MDLLLPLMLLVPAISALALALVPLRTDYAARAWTLVTTLGVLVVSLVLAGVMNWGHAPELGDPAYYQFHGAAPWVEAFGLSFGFGVDSISMSLILLTTFLMPLVVLGSWSSVEKNVRQFHVWLLLLQAAMLGVFSATDILFFYICFEFTLIPLYFLIGTYGSSQRLKAAKVFFLYTFTGSMLTFAGLLYVAWFNAAATGSWSFHIPQLYAAAQSMSTPEQVWVLLAMLAGFAVKVPIFPVHTWLPLAHTEAPTAGSVILAGVLLKLGTYALLRFALPMTPEAILLLAPIVGGLAVAGILYAALVCWVQKDIKKLIAYSSVSHLGFCVLGLLAIADVIGPTGSVMYMINHGLSTGALFLCVGMIYERLHTREMAQMGGLVKLMPVWAFFMVYFCFASVGLPGLNGFVSEFLTLLGAFRSPQTLGPIFAAVAGVGMIFGAMYILYMVGKVVFGPTKLPDDHDPHHKLSDLNLREIGVLTPLAIACLVLGLYPTPLLKSLEKPVQRLIDPVQAAVADMPTLPEVPRGATLTIIQMDQGDDSSEQAAPDNTPDHPEH